MTERSPEAQTLSTAEANRRFYADVAEIYDRTEECVVDPRLRRRLRETLVAALGELPRELRVLDACGGSGNVSLMLLELGVRPVTVDLSPEMLAIYERKARALGGEPETRVADIEGFLASDRRDWDLIVFSSALHHLEDYETALDLAVARLRPGGLLVTMFDPARVGPLGERIRRLDYVAHVVARTPRRVPATVARRVRRRAGADAHAEASVGDRAERHALGGIDDLALGARFQAAGLDVLVHDRLYEGRFAVTRLLYRVLRTASSFHFVVRRPSAESPSSDAAHRPDEPREER